MVNITPDKHPYTSTGLHILSLVKRQKHTPLFLLLHCCLVASVTGEDSHYFSRWTVFREAGVFKWSANVTEGVSAL